MQTSTSQTAETSNWIRERQCRAQPMRTVSAQLCWAGDTQSPALSPFVLNPRGENQHWSQGPEQPLCACCLPRLHALITPAQMANGFLLSLLMSQRRMEQVCSLAAWPFRPLCTKEKRLWELQQHNKGDGCFPKNTTLGSSHGKQQVTGAASTSWSPVCPSALHCDTHTLCLRQEVSASIRGELYKVKRSLKISPIFLRHVSRHPPACWLHWPCDATTMR